MDDSSVAWFGMSRMQLATHLKALAADVEFGGPRPGERIVVSIDDWTPAVGFHAELSRFFHREVSHL